MSKESLLKSYKKVNNSKKTSKQRLLGRYGYEFDNDGNIVVDLRSPDGTNFGKITYDAYKAIESGSLNSYKPKNEEEKSVLEKYRKTPSIPLKLQDGKDFGNVSYDTYNAIVNLTGGNKSKADAINITSPIRNFIDKQYSKLTLNDDEKKVVSNFKSYIDSKEKQARINSNPVYKKYNIDPLDFDEKDLQKWTEEHNFQMTIRGDGTSYYRPKYEGGFLGIGAKKLTTSEEDADLKVLNQLVSEKLDKKMRENLSKTGYGKALLGITDAVNTGVSAVVYPIEKAGAGLLDGLSDGGKFIFSTGAKLLSLPAWGSWEEGLNKYAEDTISMKTLGDYWNESAEARHDLPDWYRKYVGDTLYGVGSLSPAILAEYLSAGSSPLLETSLANMVLARGSGSVAKNIATKLVKPKVSDVAFGLTAAGSAAEYGYKQSGNIGKALNYGVLNGLGEVFTEKLFGGIAGTGIGASGSTITKGNRILKVLEGTDDLIDLSKIKYVSKLASTKYGKKVLDIALEGVEESIMAVADPFMQRATGVNPNAKNASLKDIGESALQGMLLSGVMNAATFSINKYQKTKAIDILNTTTDSINALLNNDSSKFEPLKKNATIEEIEERQKQIKVFARGYADLTVDQLTKLNPEMFKDIEKVSVGDMFVDTKTGNTFTVTSRDDTKTVVAINTENGVLTKELTNNQIDNSITSEQVIEVVDTANDILTEENTTIDTPVVENATTKQRNTFTEELDEIASTEMPTVSVGDTFIESGTNNILRIVDRNDTITIIEITTPKGKKETITRVNQGADTLAVNDRYKKVNTSDLTSKGQDDILNNDDVTEARNINEVDKNGTDSSRKTFENDERYSKMQTESRSKAVQNRSVDGLYSETSEGSNKRGYRDVSSRTRKSETRRLEDITENDDFIELARFIGNEMPKSMYDVLKEEYYKDTRTDTYDFSDVITYDILTGQNNELYDLFEDNILEYFNNQKNEVDKNGTDARTSVLENDKRYSEMQTEEQAGGISQIRNRESNTGSEEVQPERIGYRRTEERSLNDIYENDDFIYLSRFIGDEISLDIRNNLFELYKYDSRLSEEGYDFIDVVAYDILTGKNNELYDLFEDNVLEYFNNQKNEVDKNGTDARTSVLENDKRYSEMQVESGSKTIQNGNVETIYTKSTGQNDGRGYRDNSGRTRKSETRKLEDITENNDFIELSRFVGNEISLEKGYELNEEYRYDKRLLEEGYDFSDVITYDILTGQNNELYNLFEDNILEYFNNQKNEVDKNGTDTSRKTLKNDERYSKMQTESRSETVQNRSVDGLYSESNEGNDGRGYQDISQGTRKSETRKLEDIVENDNFIELVNFVGNEISIPTYNKLKEIYDNDTKFDLYDFTDVVTYDILTGQNNELYDLFEDNILEYFNNQKNEVDKNGTDARTNILKDGDEFSQSTTEFNAGEILQRRNKINNSERRLSQTDGRRYRTVEESQIQELVGTDKFIKLSKYVASEISHKQNKELYEKYKNDIRWEQGYEFPDMVTYDILVDENNELRKLFYDSIEEYFNSDKNSTTDITGRELLQYIMEGTKDSVVRNKNGQLIPVYHATNAEFEHFTPGDIGIHFGSKAQANQRAIDKEYENPIFIRAYLNITNPLYVDADFFGWNAVQIAQKLEQDGVITSEQALEIERLHREEKTKANEMLVNILKGQKYDGVVYTNEKEAINGKSYIVFDDSQVFRDDDDVNNTTNDTEKTMYDLMDELGLTYDEQGAILEYKSSESYKINRKLRKNIELSKNEEKLAQLLKTALDKFTKYQGTVYRNIGFSNEIEFNEFISKHNKGKTVKYAGFTSTSKSIDGYTVDTEYRVHYVIQSINASDVEAIGLSEEREVLFKSDTSFAIKDMRVEGKTVKIILKEDFNSEITSTEYNGENIHSDEENDIETEHEAKREGISDGNPSLRGGSSTDDRILKEESNSIREGSDRKSGFDNISDDQKVRNDGNAKGQTVSIDVVSRNDTLNLTDKCELVATKHTSTGDDIWVVTLKDRLSSEEYKELSSKVKSVGGYYSRFAKTPEGKAIPGFVFKSEPDGDAIQVFNDFFGPTEDNESVAETKYDHLYDEAKVSKAYFNSVNHELENAIISIRNGDTDSVPDIINVVELDEKTIKAISDFVGYDVNGYSCKIERDRLVHIENRHGINGKHDQSLSDPKDTARIGCVVNNSDNIEWATDEKGNRVYDSKYNDRHNKIAPVFVMEKRIDGTYSISQVVPDSKKKTLWITSARIEKAAVGSQVPNADNSPQLTPETPLNSSSASNNIVSQDNHTVNNSVRAESENENEKYSIESGDNKDEQTRNLLSDGNGGRSYSPSAKRQTKKLDGRTSRYRERRATAYERRKYCQTLKTSGHTRRKIVYGHECEVISAEHYTKRMTKIAEQNQKYGFDETVFVTGEIIIPFVKDKKGNPKKAKGVYIKENGKKIVIVQYDNELYLPEQINDHETVHDRYHTSIVQKTKNVIMNSLSVAEKKKVLEKLSRDYNDIIEGNEEAIIEEFVANVLSNMDYEYSGVFAELQRAYWKGDEQFIDNYKVSEYNKLIDTGDSNASILESIGLGNDYRLSESFGDIPYREYVQLRNYIVQNNNSADVLLSADCKEIGDNFYIWNNTSKTDFTVVGSIPIVGNEDFINAIRSEITNGTYRGTENFNTRINRIRSGKRGRAVLDGRTSRSATDGNNDRLSARQPENDTRRNLVENSGTDTPVSQTFKSAGTSLNQVAALFKNKNFHPGKVNIDIGGGKFDATSNFLRSLGTENYVFDPFNRTEQENTATLDFLMSGKKADTVTCANVLNVIDTEAARLNVILETAKAIKPDGTAYFTVYTSDNSGVGRQTQADSWQNARKTEDYVSEIETYFNNVERRGSIIIAKEPKADLPQASWEVKPGKAFRYALSTCDADIENLTPQRKKEILEQFNKDRVGLDKPTLKQLWDESVQDIAHNMTRVFPNIPERGEKGVFFAEFRKMMIQWKALPQTSMFMTQDKLNQMTKELTPDEFKTFSELVYFLDLQEEAQIQKEHGYEEILLPNGIAPFEVNQIVEELNKEATNNVKNALEKRRQMWNELKEQYVTLNQYVGFDTSEKFKRKNYYHHQVIEHINNGGKGVAKGNDIEIKAGRGWLKERHGSTSAINTDFLAVEYKAMLQMQYDIYVANMLGKIKDKYDIKPQLEKQAFNNNKKFLNDIIKEEATDEEGNVLFDNKGNPDSETYRMQQWYNQRIMFGFSGLFDLAKANVLPTLNGQYNNVISALENGSLKVAGLYNYVGELASMELSENATDEDTQAQISARTVLKYTSQKKAWIKEILAENYQTWETLARELKETYSIHQPRRGNYFYTKEVLNEDAFNSAFNDMILKLTSAESGIELTNDVKKMFEQYSETIRQIGAAYEQWVIPNEIVTTMQEVANPRKVGRSSKISRTLLSIWKGWSTSVNPLRTVKFGIRNLFGDLDAVIAGNPKIAGYSKRAVNEIYQAMKNKKYSSEFMEWVERGGYSSLIFANEMDTEMQDKLFSHLKEKEGLNVFKIPVKLYEGYYNGVETAHNFREAILRYSAYLYFKNDIVKNEGKVKDNVASNRFIIKGLESIEDKAYQLSKDLLGAYDEVATMGQVLRRHAIPFYSFTETNLKRYYRLFENIIMSDDNIPKKTRKLLLKGLMVNLLTLLMVAWNRLVMEDEDDKLPPQTRNVPHITLGRIGDDIYAFRQLGSFSELLEWIGFEDYKWTKEDLTAPIDKVAGMITPIAKAPVELASGFNFYPSITKPRRIRDRWEHLFSTWGVDSIYRIAVGKPTRGIGDTVKDSVIYSYDYEESAYYEILDIKRKYQGKEDGASYEPTAKSNALYYMKTAIKYKDKDAALKYLDEYLKNGGTAKGITQSIAMLDPMYGYTSKNTIEKGQAFVNSLSDDERDKLKIAIDYYENDLMLPKEVSAMLRKKGMTEDKAKNLLTSYIKSKCK